MELKLYHYWRSSSSWRVRWALFEKELACDFIAVNLLESEQIQENHSQRNPMGAVPVLEVLDDDNKTHFLSESSAIIEWIDEFSDRDLLVPNNSFDKAQVRHLTQIVNSGIQPLQNLAVLKKLDENEVDRDVWSKHWIEKGLKAYEKIVSKTAGLYSVGDSLTMADLFLIPQLYNARRFNLDLEVYPTILKIEESCNKRDAAKAARPDQFKPE